MCPDVKAECDLADLRAKVEHAPQIDILRAYVLKVMDSCDLTLGKPEKGAAKKESKGKRKPTERATFMGTCMRSPAKGGQGKPMKDCSAEWAKTHPKKDGAKK
jgi:hypothetical protein